MEVGATRHLTQRDAFGQSHFRCDVGDSRDHDRLRLLGHKPRRTQPLRQIARLIVPVKLPLEAFAARGEHLHLPRDQVIELRALEPTETR